MIRNYEIDCRDLFECTHEPQTPISEDGEIVGWLCRCGRRVASKERFFHVRLGIDHELDCIGTPKEEPMTRPSTELEEELLVRALAEDMRKTLLEKRSEKTVWKEQDVDDLVRGMMTAHQKLCGEIFDAQVTSKSDEREHALQVRRKCAHLANWIAMIYDTFEPGKESHGQVR
jgi:hypothetical protein